MNSSVATRRCGCDADKHPENKQRWALFVLGWVVIHGSEYQTMHLRKKGQGKWESEEVLELKEVSFGWISVDLYAFFCKHFHGH